LFSDVTDMLLGNGLYTVLGVGTSREVVVVADLVLRSYLVLATSHTGTSASELNGKLVLVPGTNPATWVALAGLLERRGVGRSVVRTLPCLTIEDAVDLH